MTVAVIIVMLCLITMVYQDLRHRHIHVLLPVLLFITGIYITTNNYVNGSNVMITVYNFAFIIVTIFILVMYMSLKNKAFINPFTNYFGLGDLLFFIAITPLFLLRNYVLFFILSLVFSIVLYFVFKKLYKVNNIPLAGYASLLLLIVIIKDVLLNCSSLTLI